MSRFARVALALVIALVWFGTSLAEDAPKDAAKKDEAKTLQPDEGKAASATELKIIKPEEAKDYEGKDVTVEFKVAGGREIDSGVCFLNSTTDRNDPNGFTAFISKDGLKRFKEDAKIDKPADHFKKKTIRVTGKVKTYQKKFEIEVTSPDQIKVVEEATKDEKKS
jgi:DNA/RNA endonuclease YhcR with UshA esterase domain